MPLLQRLAQTFRPASIVVIEPDAGHPLLDQARATGAHVMIGPPSSPRVLLPVIAGSRGCALRRLYALRDDVTDNEAVLDAAQDVLRRYRPTRTGNRISSPASMTRATPTTGAAGASAAPAAGSRTPSAPTNRPRLPCSSRSSAPHPASCCSPGTAPWPWPSCRELARRAWERRQLAEPPRPAPGPEPTLRAAAAAGGRPATAAPLPVQRVVLLDRRAEDLRREYLATSPPPMVRALCEVRRRSGLLEGPAPRHRSTPCPPQPAPRLR